jgi:hypothetical protein
VLTEQLGNPFLFFQVVFTTYLLVLQLVTNE